MPLIAMGSKKFGVSHLGDTHGWAAFEKEHYGMEWEED